MLGNEIQDYQQQRKMQKYGNENLGIKEKVFLKSLLKCGKVVVRRYDDAKAVALMKNNKTARFTGLNSCKSPWCCPVCTSRQMARYATKIGCAIDALKEQGLAAVMITFTVPHTSGFTCEQTTEILYNCWKAFTIHGNKVQGSAVNDAFSNFMAEFGSKHRVRVCEYTWGLKGWHPHFHCLFWFPANRVNEILEWEGRLRERWLELCKRYTIRQLLIGYPETQRKTVREQVKTRVRIMYSKLSDEPSGVWISKSNGKVTVAESSTYICGWGANREVTGNYQNKATKEGHYSWQQILQLAIDGDTTHDWWKLFFEYAMATRKYRHARINFSVHSGLSRIIVAYQNTAQYKLVLKKNAEENRKTYGIWKTVCWFTVAQWKSICCNELEIEILKLATLDDNIQKITELLRLHDIAPPIIDETAGGKLEAIWNAA